jgi:hypothetical protein
MQQVSAGEASAHLDQELRRAQAAIERQAASGGQLAQQLEQQCEAHAALAARQGALEETQRQADTLQALHEEQVQARAQADLDAAARHERLAAEVEAKAGQQDLMLLRQDLQQVAAQQGSLEAAQLNNGPQAAGSGEAGAQLAAQAAQQADALQSVVAGQEALREAQLRAEAREEERVEVLEERGRKAAAQIEWLRGRVEAEPAAAKELSAAAERLGGQVAAAERELLVQQQRLAALRAAPEEQAGARAQAERDAAARHERLAAEVEAKVSEVVREAKASAAESSVVVAAVADAGSEILPAPAWSAVTERCTALEQAVAQLDEACAGTLEEAGVLPSSRSPRPSHRRGRQRCLCRQARGLRGGGLPLPLPVSAVRSPSPHSARTRS